MSNYFQRNSRLFTKTFSQDAQSLYRNQPRFPFEYYITINLNNIETAKEFISNFYNNDEWQQVMPLVKSVDMPAMKIETEYINQYNRRRLVQSKLSFETTKLVFHDVADGKTLKFWDMYYRYYFGEGNEPGTNTPKQPENTAGSYSYEEFKMGAAYTNAEFSKVKSVGTTPADEDSPTNTVGDKSTLQNIISDTLDNHNFGYNLPVVKNIKNLIQSIEIYQVHAGRYNKVTLVNPRIASFTHDTLNYATDEKTLEISFSIQYEYAFYSIENMALGGSDAGNNSSTEAFQGSGILELQSLGFSTNLQDYLQGPNPALPIGDIMNSIPLNTQPSLQTIMKNPNINNGFRQGLSSVLGGSVNLQPPVPASGITAKVVPQPFNQTAATTTSMYPDLNRIGGNPGV